MTHLNVGALVAVAICSVATIAMSMLAIFVARKRKDEKKAFYAKRSDYGVY
jgi:hypothetical protein